MHISCFESTSNHADSRHEHLEVMLSLKPRCPVQAQFVQGHAQIHNLSLERGLVPSRHQRVPREVVISKHL